MTESKRDVINTFKAAVNLIQTGPDGYPVPGQASELEVLLRLVEKVESVTAEERSLNSAR